uniref:Uncharacterized protein n=1 Tax=Timema cristinae TaxID=61476 RepID=A0A7R9CGM1_TIMCR|nr:unnamed protein product [Timema cristinae]
MGLHVWAFNNGSPLFTNYKPVLIPHNGFLEEEPLYKSATGKAEYGKLRRSASFSKLRASLRRSSAKLMQKLTNRGASTIEGYSNSMKRASSLSVLSGHNTEQHARSNVASLRGRTASTEQLLLQNAT